MVVCSPYLKYLETQVLLVKDEHSINSPFEEYHTNKDRENGKLRDRKCYNAGPDSRHLSRDFVRTVIRADLI